MKKVLLCFLIATAFTCKKIDFGILDSIWRCENDEVICYNYNYAHGTGISCKWKEKAE